LYEEVLDIAKQKFDLLTSICPIVFDHLAGILIHDLTKPATLKLPSATLKAFRARSQMIYTPRMPKCYRFHTSEVRFTELVLKRSELNSQEYEANLP
jgi:hypothetical protein